MKKVYLSICIVSLLLCIFTQASFAKSYKGKVIDVFGDNITKIKIPGGHPFKVGDQVDLTYKAGVLPMMMGIYEVTMIRGNTFLCKSGKMLQEPSEGMSIEIELYKRVSQPQKNKKEKMNEDNLDVSGAGDHPDNFVYGDGSIKYSNSTLETQKIIHAFVALCDNKYQGIIPVPPKLGNGDDPGNNLYWGAKYGVKTLFKRSSDWKLIKTFKQSGPVLERCVFKSRHKNVYFVADAYRGRFIKNAVVDFLNAASGKSGKSIQFRTGNENINLNISGGSNLIVYIGHNGLMDFKLNNYPAKSNNELREVIILACFSKRYFKGPISKTGAKPLIWTTGLMAPEAYIIEAAFEGWILKESNESISLRAARAYNKYQKCGLRSAKRLLVSGF